MLATMTAMGGSTAATALMATAASLDQWRTTACRPGTGLVGRVGLEPTTQGL